MSVKAVIFDKDGVLMDTEDVYISAWQAIVNHFGNKSKYSKKEHIPNMGLQAEITVDKLRRTHGLLGGTQEILAFYRKFYGNIFETVGLDPMEGIVDLLDVLKERKIKMGVATSAGRKSTALTLRKAGILSYFDVVVTREDVSKGKPDPEVFTRNAQLLKVEPHEALVIGDSDNDRLGAKKAGIKFIFITDRKNSYESEIPDLVVPSIKNLTLEILQSL